MKLIIPCAGESSRMFYVPKHLIRVSDKPLVTHIIDAWKDIVDSFVFVVKRSMTCMWEFFPENSAITFQDEPKGLADAILRAEKCVSGKFIINLGDCVFKGKFEEKKFDLGIGVWKTNDLTEINKSYLVGVGPGGLVACVDEKPNLLSIPEGHTRNCGMGTYFLDERVFDYIRNYKGKPGGGDFTGVLQAMIEAGEAITPVWFEGEYVNVTSPEDIEKAERIFA